MLRQNEAMLKEKIQFNKIGLKFMINFLYREPQAAHHWENIHKSQFQELRQYKQYLFELFAKYKVPLDATLAQFNSENHQKVELNFALLNATKLKYEYFTSEEQSQLKLVDLMLAAISLPVYFGAYPLPVQDRHGFYDGLLGKINHKLERE
jgi:hypothetical protein